VRLVVEGRDLGRSDDDPLAACLRRDRAAAGPVRVHALVHRTDARAAAARAGTESGDEEPLDAEGLRRSRELLRSPRALLARRAETYDALFELSDGACAVVRARAQELLRALPTRGDGARRAQGSAQASFGVLERFGGALAPRAPPRGVVVVAVAGRVRAPGAGRAS
jgi:hypothetical protein